MARIDWCRLLGWIVFPLMAWLIVGMFVGVWYFVFA